jgi:hypothetical protein
MAAHRFADHIRAASVFLQRDTVVLRRIAMPFLEPVEETYWDPGWWPWEWLDTSTRTVQKWCYYFNYYNCRAWGFWRNLTACEGAVQYSWTEAGFYTSSFVAGDTGAVGSGPYKDCFDKRKPQGGRCTENLATGSSGLTPSTEPYIGRTTVGVKELAREVVEQGTAMFTPENSHRCRQGDWPWERVRHSQEIEIAVGFGQVDVSWSINGFSLTPGSGTIQVPTFSSWPAPVDPKSAPTVGPSGTVLVVRHYVLPNLATVTYSTDATVPGASVLRLRNRPADGNFDIDVRMIATLNGAPYHSQLIVCHFAGETIVFDAKQREQEMRCFLDRYKVGRGAPHPDGPVIDLGYLRQAMAQERQDAVSDLLALVEGVAGRDAEASTILLTCLSEEMGATGALRALGGPPRKEQHARPSKKCGCGDR